MTIPYIHIPLTNKGILNGIIYKLKQTLTDDIIISDYVTPSSIRDQIGQKNELITWSDSEYQAGPGSASNCPWIQLTFPNHYMYPTAYSMRGVLKGHCIATSWHIYGIYENDEDNEKNWELLGVNDTSE